MYILFFQVKSMKDTRTYVARLCETVEEALEQREEIINHGWHDEIAIYTSIKEGRA